MLTFKRTGKNAAEMTQVLRDEPTGEVALAEIKHFRKEHPLFAGRTDEQVVSILLRSMLGRCTCGGPDADQRAFASAFDIAVSGHHHSVRV